MRNRSAAAAPSQARRDRRSELEDAEREAEIQPQGLADHVRADLNGPTGDKRQHRRRHDPVMGIWIFYNIVTAKLLGDVEISTRHGRVPHP